jgi:hypothetical protein
MATESRLRTALLARANLKVVSEFSYCGSGFVTTQDPAGYDELERTSLVEQHWPIDENLDPFAHWKKVIGLQEHAAAADVQRCGLNSISSQYIFRPGKDRVSPMLPTFRLGGAGPGLYVGE